MKAIKEQNEAYGLLTVEPQHSISAKEKKAQPLSEEEEIALKVNPEYSGIGRKTTIDAKICGGRFKWTNREC